MNARFATLITAFLVVVGTFAHHAHAQLKAGAATSNITPPLGGGILGGFLPIPAEQRLLRRGQIRDSGLVGSESHEVGERV